MCAAPSPADDPSLRLTVSARERLDAVVFDANAYGKARPDLEHLKRLASRLAGIGIQTWIPESVAWEWAEHVACDWETVKNAARQERDRMNRAGIPVAVPSHDSRQTIIEAVLTNLSALPHVYIIELTGRSAIEGLKDQVLQRKPGKTKGGSPGDPGSAVKTGASDSAWLRDVLDRAAPDKILIVGADRDIGAAFRAWGKQEPLTRTLNQLRSTLFEITVDDGHAQAAVVRHLAKQLPVDTLDSDGTGFDIGHIAGLETAITNRTDGDGSSLSIYGASVTRLVALAGVGEVSIGTAAPDDAASQKEPAHAGRPNDLGPIRHNVAYATVYFLAEGEATVQTLYNGGDPDVSVLSYDNVLVRAELGFHFADGVITAVTAEAEAQATLVEDAFDDETEPLHRMDEALEWVPGLALEVSSLLYSNSPEAVAHVQGTSAQVTAAVTPKDDTWDLEMGVAHDTAKGDPHWLEVTCTYDPSSWWGGHRDGFQGPDGYQVEVSAPGMQVSHGVWSVPAWIISEIDWSLFEAPAAPPHQEGTDST